MPATVCRYEGPASLNEVDDAELARQIHVPVPLEVAVAVDRQIIADVLGADRVLGAVAADVERAAGCVEGTGHRRGAVALDVHDIRGAALLEERDPSVEAGERRRVVDHAGALDV